MSNDKLAVRIGALLAKAAGPAGLALAGVAVAAKLVPAALGAMGSAAAAAFAEAWAARSKSEAPC